MENKVFKVLREGEKACVYKYGDEVFSFKSAVIIESFSAIEFEHIVMLPDTLENRKELYKKAGKRIR